MEIKWLTLENESGTSTLSQHGFVATENGGNRMLCCKGYCDDGNYGGPQKFVRLVSEKQRDTCCKICANIAEKLKG
jgi:hypothetical protein